jgi:hypothetical protein
VSDVMLAIVQVYAILNLLGTALLVLHLELEQG